ncbi:MAG: metallophosphoesterase [Blastocatellia bacterium]|nr:metallophosphoesterase [Blastocatellia bacterium]
MFDAVAARTLRHLFSASLLLLLFLISTGAQSAPREPASGLLFAAIGDSGTGKKEQFAVGQAMALAHETSPFELVLMLGDNIYGGGGSKRMVEKFEAPYRALLTRGVRFQASLGNHDAGKADEETNYPFFNMGGRRYYTFTRGEGLAQFFALDSSKMDREQLAWIEKELTASKARWKIAFFHHPIYSSGRTHGSDRRLRELLEPLFLRAGVQLVLSGHDHFYERLKPQKGIAYFVSGGAGKLRRGDINRKDPAFAFGNDQIHHFMLFSIGRDAISFRAIDLKGTEIDAGTIAHPTMN